MQSLPTYGTAIVLLLFWPCWQSRKAHVPGALEGVWICEMQAQWSDAAESLWYGVNRISSHKCSFKS